MFYYNPFEMSIWQSLTHLIGKRRNTSPRTFELTERLQFILTELAEREGRPEREFLSELVVAGLDQYYSRRELLPKWESLSPREKEVAYLIHTGMTNNQMAERLSVSIETIKTHVANILRKFGVRRKSDLRHILGVLKFHHWI